MSLSQAEFVHRQNIRHYEQELSVSAAGPRRTMLLLLMAEERAAAGSTRPAKRLVV
jgi:hypothetical protein